MFMNNLKIVFRTLWRAKVYTALNILGLAIGLTCVSLIAAWSLHELSYDRFHSKKDRIFRVISRVTSESETFEQAVTSPPMAAAMKQDFPEIQNTVRLDMNDCIVRYGRKQFEEDGVLFADQSFFEVFDYPLIQGDITTALHEPYSIVLTESTARKYFGSENPLGKTMTLYLYDPDGQGAPYKITGITPDPPQNAHFTFTIIGSFSTYETVAEDAESRWFENDYYTYLLLRKDTDPDVLMRKFPDFAERYMGKEMREKSMLYSFTLQPLVDIYLHSHMRHEIKENSRMSTVYIFVTIGLFVLLLACINYINLATARSLGRAKEVGVKKVLGAGKSQLIRQFLVESTTMAGGSFVLAMLLVELLQPVFLNLTGKNFNNVFSFDLLLLILGLTLLVGMLSGLYPAFFISSFRTQEILKGDFKSSTSGILMRKGLIIVQFAIAIALITGIAVVKLQVDYIQNKNLGFDKDAILTLKVSGFAEVQKGIEPFRAELLSNNTIHAVSVSRGSIGSGLDSRYLETMDGSGKTISTTIFLHRADSNFLDAYGIPLIAGRNFTQADSQDVYLVNEAAVQRFGWGEPNQALNKPIKTEGTEGRVIGVVKDFHFATLQQAIAPVMIQLTNHNVFSNISIRLETTDLAGTIGSIERVWQQYFPDALLQYSFLDDRLDQQYQQERLFRNILTAFVPLSLVIACLGIFGIAAFNTRSRTKEIGIRKVLGATASGILLMFSKDFIKLVLMANIFAVPIAYYIMNKWL